MSKKRLSNRVTVGNARRNKRPSRTKTKPKTKRMKHKGIRSAIRKFLDKNTNKAQISKNGQKTIKITIED
jgi:hypothetical protein